MNEKENRAECIDLQLKSLCKAQETNPILQQFVAKLSKNDLMEEIDDKLREKRSTN